MFISRKYIQRWVIVGLLAAFWIGACSLARADTSGQELYTDCVQAEGTIGKTFCAGYIDGIADLAISAGDVCPLHQETYGQMMNAIINAMYLHPETLTNPANLVVAAALEVFYPCPKKEGGV